MTGDLLEQPGFVNEGICMHPEPVLNKTDFVRRYAAGEFGNASPTWNNPTEFLSESNYAGLVHIRNRVAGAETWYNVRPDRVLSIWCLALSKGYRNDQLYISAMAPTELTILQGEVQEGVWGLELTYTKVKKPMREALAEDCRHMRGLAATILLESVMNDLSFQWLRHLLNSYPDHVVEFSVYGKCWGTIPGHNTVFWEVRRY